MAVLVLCPPVILRKEVRHVHSEARFDRKRVYLSAHNYRLGCLVVIQEDRTVSGIISDQDVLRCVASTHEEFSKISVSDVMTTEVIVCHPADSLNTVRSIMHTQWLRQLPVVADDGKLLGIISLGDVNTYLITEEEVEIKFLHDYIEGRVR